MGPDLVNAAVVLKQAQLASQIQVRVAGKILDSQRMNGAGALKLLEAATLGVNKAGDELVAGAAGLGGELDVYA
jgi:hypothetical protein